MGFQFVFLIPILGICVGLVAVIGGTIVRPWLAHKERRMQLEATMVAEKAAQAICRADRTARTARPRAETHHH